MIKKAILNAINQELTEQNLQISEVVIERSKFGDYSTSFPLKLGKFKNYQTPSEIAKFFVSGLSKNQLFSEVFFSEPGFINFNINQKEAAKLLREVIGEGKDFGKNENHKGQTARVEFVSANPTGPLHIGNARGGPIGDTLASILEHNGYKVTREYYNNNIGTQVDIFGDSLVYFIKQNVGNASEIKNEEQAYSGPYMKELATKIVKDLQLSSSEEVEDKQEVIKEKGTELLFSEIRQLCESLGIKFDEVFNEAKVQQEFTAEAIKELKEKGLTKEKDGALWFAPQGQFLEDRESVLVRSDGRYTYFADDIAYHKLKFEDKPDLVVNVLGSNHHGHVPRLLAAVAALGFDVNKFMVLLYQYVRVKKGNDIVKMSKRAGNFVTAGEVLSEVGKDAFRFLLLLSSPNTHLDFDLELAKKQSSENPVFYVQYAHARICSIIAKAENSFENFDPELLVSTEEKELTKKILEFPDLIFEIGENFHVHQLTHYVVELADIFHKFYEKNKVLSEDKELSKSRLALAKATQIALANSLNLLGVSAPEKM